MEIYFTFQLENVDNCLNVLRHHSVGGLENITTNDICAGRLKAVLSLFFALSRYKQATKQKVTAPTKQQHQQQHLNSPQHLQQPNGGSNENMTNR
jgi:hypothetical protein